MGKGLLDLTEGLEVGDEPTSPAQPVQKNDNPTKWVVVEEGSVYTEPIQSVRPVMVGLTQKWVINCAHWSTTDPGKARYVSLKKAVIQRGEEKRSVINLEGFLEVAPDMALGAKIEVLRENPDIAMALATLLK